MQPQLSHSSLPSYKTHLMLLYGPLAGAVGLVASQCLRGLCPLAIKKPGKLELGRLSLYSHILGYSFSVTHLPEKYLYIRTVLSHSLLRGSIQDGKNKAATPHISAGSSESKSGSTEYF